jgi:hypothetical protein
VPGPTGHILGGDFMRTRIAVLAIGALSVSGVGAALAPAAGAAPEDTGCAAVGGTPQSSCQFTATGDPTSGYAAASDGWQITHEEIDPVTGQPITVVDASGTAPNATQFAFTGGTLYTLTVTGNGTLAGGSAQ